MAAQDRYAVLKRIYAFLEEGAVSEEEVLTAAMTVVCDLGSTLYSREELSERIEHLLDQIGESDTSKSRLRLVRAG